jgi:hypothetical protein
MGRELPTTRVPVLQAGCMILARSGIVVVREVQLSGAAIRVTAARADMGAVEVERQRCNF